MNILNKIGSFLIAIVPILGIYRFYQGINYDILFLSIFAIIYALYSQHINFKVGILYYFSVLIIINVLSFLLTGNQIPSLFISNTLYIIIFALLLGYFTTFETDNFFVPSILAIGVISTVLVFYQAILFQLFGVSSVLFFPLEMVIPPAPNFPSITYGRPNSIFTEPAHYAVYILPLLWYSLANKKYILTAIFISGIIVSTSVTGLVGGLVILLSQTVLKGKNSKVLIILAGIGLGIMVIFPEIFSSVKYFITPKLTDVETITNNERLFSTVVIFSKMDFFSLVFGLGHNQLKEFMLQNGMPNAWNFANSILMSVFSFGFLGLILLIIFLYYLYKINTDKGYFVILLLVLMSDQILFNRNFFYLIACIFLIKDTRNKYENPVSEENSGELLATV